jgi:hypothetical protein
MFSYGTHSAFKRDKNKFHPIEHVDWNGNLYWKGTILKFTAWIIGHTFQFATIAADCQFQSDISTTNCEPRGR